MAKSLRADASLPPELARVAVVEHTGQRIPEDLWFMDSQGSPIRLGDVGSRRRPIVLTLVYFGCPMFCSMVLQGLTGALTQAGVVPGRDVDLLTVSFDPRDDAERAREKRRHYLQALGLSDGGNVWPFLTGQEHEIHALADAVGFQYQPVPNSNEFAHAAVVFILTPEGVLSRYLYGLDVPTRDWRLALAEASEGRFGNTFDRVLLHCYRYDPATRRYGVYLSLYFRLGGAVLLIGLVGLLAGLKARERGRAVPRGA